MKHLEIMIEFSESFWDLGHSQKLHWKSRGNIFTYYILFDVYNWVFIVTSENFNSDRELGKYLQNQKLQALWSTVTFASKRSLFLIIKAQ